MLHVPKLFTDKLFLITAQMLKIQWGGVEPCLFSPGGLTTLHIAIPDDCVISAIFNKLNESHVNSLPFVFEETHSFMLPCFYNLNFNINVFVIRDIIHIILVFS